MPASSLWFVKSSIDGLSVTAKEPQYGFDNFLKQRAAGLFRAVNAEVLSA